MGEKSKKDHKKEKKDKKSKKEDKKNKKDKGTFLLHQPVFRQSQIRIHRTQKYERKRLQKL